MPFRPSIGVVRWTVWPHSATCATTWYHMNMYLGPAAFSLSLLYSSYPSSFSSPLFHSFSMYGEEKKTAKSISVAYGVVISPTYLFSFFPCHRSMPSGVITVPHIEGWTILLLGMLIGQVSDGLRGFRAGYARRRDTCVTTRRICGKGWGYHDRDRKRRRNKAQTIDR